MCQDYTRRAFLLGRKAVSNEDGATAIEYGLLAALIGVGVLVGTKRVGRKMNRNFRCVNQTIRRKKKRRKCK